MEKDLTQLADVVGKYLRNSNINTPYLQYYTKIQEYLDWYRGKTEWHNYKVWNGRRRISRERMCLDMAKTVCEDLSNLIINEKVEIHASDDISQSIIDSVLENNNFRVNATQLTELMFALGTGAFVENIVDGRIVIDYIHADLIFPLKWDNGEITECAFAVVGGDNKDVAYTVISHRMNEDGTYYIERVGIDVNGAIVRLSQLDDEIYKAKNVERYETGSKIPRFQIIKTNIVNNYDKTSPLGMSCYGNAIDVLKAIDETYDSLNNEFNLGKKRIFIKSGLQSVKLDEKDFKGSVYSQVDANDVQFYQLDWTGENQDKPPIYESNMTLRVAEHQQAMEMQLNLLSRKVGLGENFYTFNNNSVATATQIISSNSALYRNMKKQELVMTQAIKGMCKAILDMTNEIGGLALIKPLDVNQEITIDYDDSIIEDTGKEMQDALAEYNAGIIDKVEYFILTRKMTREQATELVNEMEATGKIKETSSLISNYGGFGGV